MMKITSRVVEQEFSTEMKSQANSLLTLNVNLETPEVEIVVILTCKPCLEELEGYRSFYRVFRLA